MEPLSTYIEDSALLCVAGVVTVVWTILKLLYNTYSCFVIYFTPSAVDFRRFGRWALVTGATDGIGKGIAREIAKLGINVLLVSRNKDKLRKVAKEIESEFRIETQYVAFDFTSTEYRQEHTSSVYDVIAETIRDLEIGILVNNVGMYSVKPNRFLKTFASQNDPSKLAKGVLDLINCNDVSMAKMTQLILPNMVARKRGLIINISSMAAYVDNPASALYAASKKFNDTFSRALSYEVEHDGVMVQSIRPGLVHTSLGLQVFKAGPSIFYPTSDTYASHMLKTIGKNRTTPGYWNHAVQTWMFRMIPEWVHSRNMKHFEKIENKNQ